METDKKKNALADIAEVLKGESVPSTESFKKKAIEHFGVESWNKHEERKRKIHLAYLIIEELAKVQIADGMSRKAIARGNCLDYKCNGGFTETVGIFTTEHFPKWICSAVNAIEKCRKIASGEIKKMQS